MPNRDRTDPLRSAQSSIFRGIEESRGNQLNAEGGKRGSDIGSTRRPAPLHEDSEPAPRDRQRKR